MARRKLSVQGKVAAAGVSVAVAGVLAGFMAAGDHTANATQTSSANSSSSTPSSASGVPSDGGATPFGDRGSSSADGADQLQPQPQTRTGGS
jgi:hypothetical protein